MTKWVIITARGEAFLIEAVSAPMAVTKFHVKFPGTPVGQCFEVTTL